MGAHVHGLINPFLAGGNGERAVGEEHGHRVGAARAIDLSFDLVVVVGTAVPFVALLEP